MSLPLIKIAAVSCVVGGVALTGPALAAPALPLEAVPFAIPVVDEQDAVEEALADMDDVFAELEDMQFQFRVGQDNRMNLSFDDSEFELDLDQILTQVASAVQLGLDEINTAEWTSQKSRWDEVSDDDLRDELDNLKDEMEELRRELRRLQKDEKRR